MVRSNTTFILCATLWFVSFLKITDAESAAIAITVEYGVPGALSLENKHITVAADRASAILIYLSESDLTTLRRFCGDGTVYTNHTQYTATYHGGLLSVHDICLLFISHAVVGTAHSSIIGVPLTCTISGLS